eukprot:scaffold1111_cov17-Tisochrysis_lutea.AAC.1
MKTSRCYAPDRHGLASTPDGMKQGVQREAQVPHRVHHVLDVDQLVSCDLVREDPEYACTGDACP